MRIKAKTKYGRYVYIVQFLVLYNELYAIAVNFNGEIEHHKVGYLTIIDKDYTGGV